MTYSGSPHPPDVETYRRLHVKCGLSLKTQRVASKALTNTFFAVQALFEGETVGLGRVVGDGGCFYQVIDIAVLPRRRGRGLGKLITAEVRKYIRGHVPEGGYVRQPAGGRAQDLYTHFGSRPTALASAGMYHKVTDAA
jgi:ribosomal protein S18 acetylase RimI-like enzyme